MSDMPVFDGMILTDAEADRLPGWLCDDNSSLELLATHGDVVPGKLCDRLWRLHLHRR